MSGLAVFGLKYASLLRWRPGHPRQHDDSVEPEEFIRGQASTIRYGVTGTSGHGGPTGSTTGVQAVVQCAYSEASEVWIRFTYLDGHYLFVGNDGHGVFFVVDGALRELLRDCIIGTVEEGTYYHQILGAVLVHPLSSRRGISAGAGADRQGRTARRRMTVLRNAAKRLLQDAKDRLSIRTGWLASGGGGMRCFSNGPHIESAQDIGHAFRARRRSLVDHLYASLFSEWVDTTSVALHF